MTQAGAPFRDDEPGLRARRDDALVAWSTELAVLGGQAEAIIVARWAKVATGVVALATYAAIALLWALRRDVRPTDEATLLLWTLPALLVPLVAVSGRRLGRLWMDHLLRGVARPSADARADVDRLHAYAPGRMLDGLAGRAEPWAGTASLVLAGLAFALVSSAGTLALTIVPLEPFQIVAFVFGKLLRGTVWMLPVFLIYAALVPRRWARVSDDELERPSRTVGVALAAAVAVATAGLVNGIWLDRRAWIVAGAAGAQAAIVLYTHLRLRRRLVRERRVLAVAQARGR